MEHTKNVETKAFQYKGLMIYKENGWYKIEGYTTKYPAIYYAKKMIDDITNPFKDGKKISDSTIE